MLASAALFVALTGGATAAGIIVYAKHAGSADVATNAKHLDGKTAAQIVATVHGQTGPQGPAGAAGAVGPAGPKGDTGADGPGGAQGPKGDTGAQGPQGAQGDAGADLNIVGTVATQSALPTTGSSGDAYLVNGDLFVWTGQAWTDAGPVQGPKGDKGDTGPSGPQGDPGPQGIPGVAGTAAVSIHTKQFAVGVGPNDFVTIVTANCDAGQKAINAGFDSNGDVYSVDTKPTLADDGWQIVLVNNDPNNPATGTVYVVCLG
jgi:hypothetical protein